MLYQREGSRERGFSKWRRFKNYHNYCIFERQTGYRKMI